MDVTTRNRKELKSYFVKNSIPTESNFAELIDGLLNQKDDGLVKLPGTPLSVEAAGDSTSEKKALQIYQSFNDQSPAWSVSLNPRASAGDATSARPGLNISDGEGKSRLFIDRSSGNAGLGTISPVAKLDILSANRSGTHPAAVKGLYVTGDFGADSDGIEFRLSNGTQGIGFGSNTIYATGSNANQDLNLKARGTGLVKVQGSLQVTGAITPSAGNSSGNGIMFPTDPFGGSGDSAWVRYHNARGGEKGTLEIGIGNDADDHIALVASGGVSIGSAAAEGPLDINRGTADAQADIGSSSVAYGAEKADLILTRRHSATKSLNGYPASLIDFRVTNPAEEWSVAQLLAVVDLNQNPTNWGGGLAILTASGGATDATGRRTKGGAMAVRMVVDGNGSVGIGTTAPVAKLDILSVARSGTHPTAVKGLYVTGDFAADSDGVEFRRSNATQGIGFGYNTIYATGSDTNQDLNLKPRGTGVVKAQSSLQVSGAITPSLGNTSSNGIMFPANPFGGTTDSAWVRYHNARGGESGTLELGIGNDAEDHIVLLPSGNVGVNTTAPVARLDVLSATRSGTHPTAIKGLYVTGDFGGDSDGVEFRHSNSTQGLGFGYNTIYAAGTNTNQDLGLKPRGTGVVKVSSSIQVSGYVAAQQVYFSAYLDSNTRSGAQDPLPMQQTSQNVGSAYSTSTSKFTAPVKGVYLFTMTGQRTNESLTAWLQWMLMVNGAAANSGGTTTDESDERCILSWPNTIYGTASRTIILTLNAGDLVHIKQTGTGRCDNYRSSLEGTLLYATL